MNAEVNARAARQEALLSHDIEINKLRLEEAALRKQIAEELLPREQFLTEVEKKKAEAEMDFLKKKYALELEILTAKLKK